MDSSTLEARNTRLRLQSCERLEHLVRTYARRAERAHANGDHTTGAWLEERIEWLEEELDSRVAAAALAQANLDAHDLVLS